MRRGRVLRAGLPPRLDGAPRPAGAKQLFFSSLLRSRAGASSQLLPSRSVCSLSDRGGGGRAQARDESICSPGRPTLTAETGTLSDDQTGQPIDCTQGGCGGADASCFGGICSGGRNGYGDNLDCGKHIHAPSGNTISLTFTYIALESGAGCPQPGCDTVTVYDGANDRAPVLGSFSGALSPPRPPAAPASSPAQRRSS